jgi:hypothetical protein
MNTETADPAAPRTFKDLALPLAARGIPVIPVNPFAKDCYLPGGEERGTTDTDRILAWDRENPSYNVGCLGTQDGITVLDCDIPGLMTRIELETGHKLPSTFTVKSAGKGCAHLYFKQTDVSRRLGNKKGDGLFDLRGHNHYVVGPGSQLKLADGSVKEYRIWRDAPIAPFPDWLEEWIIKNSSSKKSGTAGELDEDSYIRLKKAYMTNLDPEDMFGLENLTIASLHPTLHSLACLLHDSKRDEEEVVALLERICEAYGHRDSRGRSELEGIVTHAFTKAPCDLTLPESHPSLTEGHFYDDLWVTTDENAYRARVGEPPLYPTDALECDAISDFVHAVTDGTGIPPQFVRSAVSSAVELAADFRIGYPNHENIHMRPYVINISNEPRTGKGEARKRTFEDPGLGKLLLEATSAGGGAIHLLEGTNCGSGQFAVKKIADLRDVEDNRRRALDSAGQPGDLAPDADIGISGALEINGESDVYRVLKEFGLPSERDQAVKLNLGKREIDLAFKRDWKKANKLCEGEVLKERDDATVREPQPDDDFLRVWLIHDELLNAYKAGETSTEEMLLTAYERSVVAHGSFKNGERRVDGVSLGFSGDTTRKIFEEIFTGRASANSGFLARCKLYYAEKKRVHDWQPADVEKALKAVRALQSTLSALPRSRIGGNNRFVPAETNEARLMREEFLRWLDEQNAAYTAELDSHFRRDVLVRVIASGATHIDAQHVRPAISWTKYQLALRQAMYPADHADVVGQITSRMLALLDRDPEKLWTDRTFDKFLHLDTRNHGTSEHYVRARRALLHAGAISEFGINRKGSYLYQRSGAAVLVFADDKQRLEERKKQATKN